LTVIPKWQTRRCGSEQYGERKRNSRPVREAILGATRAARSTAEQIWERSPTKRAAGGVRKKWALRPVTNEYLIRCVSRLLSEELEAQMTREAHAEPCWQTEGWAAAGDRQILSAAREGYTLC